jgi:hypothetical protein
MQTINKVLKDMRKKQSSPINKLPLISIDRIVN